MIPPPPRRFRRLARLAAALALIGSAIRADEGMWLFNAPPREQLQSRHGFTPTDAWLEHLMRSAVKFSGGSAAFVSADGLVITNHHVGRSRIQQLSTPERDLMRDGFLARTRAEELKCAGLSITVLQSIEDVTGRIAADLPAGATAAERRQLITRIEQESRAATGLQSTVVSLYEGGRSHLYRMKRYDDVRLVFAPEFAIAHYGGDVDNFEYPRFCLDVCFFRVYEHGQPVRPVHYLKWHPTGAREGDLVFVAGHPGNTDRLLTVAQLEYLRDVQLPYTLEGLRRNEVALKNWGARDRENARRAARFLLSIENSRKRGDGQIAALQDAAFLDRRRQAEEAFKRELTVAGRTGALEAFAQIATTQQAQARDFERYQLLALGEGFASQAGVLARSVMSRIGSASARAAEAPADPGEAVRVTTAATDTFLPDLEILRLTASLTRLVERLGATDPAVQHVLAGKSPRARAIELTAGTRVLDAEVRAQLVKGGPEAIDASTDPWIVLLRGIDAEVRALRRGRLEQTEAIRRAHSAIAEARFELRGTDSYPDATGTLRLSSGLVKGYEEDGRVVPPLTDFAGLSARAAQQQMRYPFELPPRWTNLPAGFNSATPFNFVCTTDTVGGNSGSPAVNRAGEFVGIVFDGNLQTLSRPFAYDEEQARTVNVHSAGITEALRAIYQAEALLAELTAGGS